MQIDSQLNTNSLAALGKEAADLLRSGELGTLASRYGYALAFDREPEAAIREDLASLFTEPSSTSPALALAHSEATVKYLEPNEAGLIAVIECSAHTLNGAKVLLELVVTGSEMERHLTLEQISAAA